MCRRSWLKNSLIFLLLTLMPELRLQASSLHEWELREHLLRINQKDYPLLAQDKGGLIWCGGSNGLAYYDGRQIIPVLDSVPVVYLGMSAKHGLLAATKTGDIWQQTPREPLLFSRLAISQHLQGKLIRKIVGLPDGRLLIATYGHGLVMAYPNGRVKALDDALPSTDLYDILEKNGQLWIATDAGLVIYSLEREKTDSLLLPEYTGDFFITSLTSVGKQIFAGTFSGELIEFRERQGKWRGQLLFRTTQPIQNIAPARSGLIVQEEKGALFLYSFEEKKRQDLRPESLHFLYDREENLHVSVSGGHLHSTWLPLWFSPTPFRQARAIHRSKRHGTLIAAEKGLYCRRETQEDWQLIPGTGALMVTCFFENDHQLWLGTFDKGLYCLGQGQWVAYTQSNSGLPNNNILCLTGNSQSIWVSTLNGIAEVRLSEKEPRIVTPQKEFKGLYAYSLLLDQKGRLWIGTDGKGLICLDQEKLYRYEEPFRETSIYDLAENQDGLIWAGTSDLGIWTIELNGEIRQVVQGTEAVSHVHHLGNNIMLAFMGEEMLLHYPGYQSAIALKKASHTFRQVPDIRALYNQGRELWICSDEEISRISIPSLGHWLHPNLYLAKALVNGKQTLASGASLRSDENSFSLEILALWYRNPEELRFRYRLNGLDSQWRYTRDNRFLFSTLNPGSYTFEFEALVNLSEDSRKFILLPFNIAKPFYRQTWFILFSILLLAGVLYSGFRLRLRRLTQRQALEKERLEYQLSTLRDQVNPHFLFNSFNTLQGLIELDARRANQYAEDLSQFFRNLLLLQQQNSISLREELELLENYLRLQKQRFGNKFKVTIEIPESSLPAHISPMTLQMLIENALKHNAMSQESPLHIHIYHQEERYIVVENAIQEKHSPEPGTGTGLKNISSRSILLCGEDIRVNRESGFFRVSVPLQRQV